MDPELGRAIKRVAIVCCGVSADSGRKCPGEWRCYRAAAFGEGKFGEPCQVISFLRCECPVQGKARALNEIVSRLLEMRPDSIHLSYCLVNSKKVCPLGSTLEFAGILEERTGIPVILGTHDD